MKSSGLGPHLPLIWSDLLCCQAATSTNTFVMEGYAVKLIFFMSDCRGTRSYEHDLMAESNVTTAVRKLPPALKKNCFMYLTNQGLHSETLLMFDTWLGLCPRKDPGRLETGKQRLSKVKGIHLHNIGRGKTKEAFQQGMDSQGRGAPSLEESKI